MRLLTNRCVILYDCRTTQEGSLTKVAVEDRLEIQDLLYRYAYALDVGDEDDLLAVFVDEPVLESAVTGNKVGLDHVRAISLRAREKRHIYRLRHMISNFQITGDADQASVTAYFAEFITWIESSRPYPSTELQFVGHYDCDVVKIGGEWRIARRAVHVDCEPDADVTSPTSFRFEKAGGPSDIAP